jgi:hypothetical protein
MFSRADIIKRKHGKVSPLSQFGNSEIHNLDLPAVSCLGFRKNHDIFRFDAPMNDALGVGKRKGVGNRNGKL